MTEINTKQLLQNLLQQHQQLRKDLTGVSLALREQTPNCAVICENMDNFKKNLEEHLTLEDGSFYPFILKKLEENAYKVEETKKFIDEMKELGERVRAVYAKYPSEEIIKNNIAEFTKDFTHMASEILLRVSIEEDGVYVYLSMF